ncbi:CIR protein [Plasmodium chabaudi chabaudi]|uniref:CIR protein n=1 Tax=Plasmodium chabaudi chabaudi TaxID=31271 RepID=A0A1D3L947_PLACU|nr:CIR protein [Plasmodium chabaudi chabaudi]
MNVEKVCNLFLNSDEYFNEKNIVNSTRFNKDGRYDQYCHVNNYVKKCETNEHRIAAMSTYLFMELEGERNEDYGKYFLMWLSDKLFKIVKDKDKDKENSITLNEAYDQYLKNNIGNFDYWHLLWHIRGLKDANLRNMHELYKLLMYICKTIADYKRNGANNKNLRQKSVDCLNQYRNLYNNLPKCNSYLHLLDKLKKIYDDFRENAIKKDIDKKNNIANRLQELTTPNKTNSYFASAFDKFDFKNSECVQLNSKTEQKQTQSSSTQVEKKEKAEVKSDDQMLSQSPTQLSEPKQIEKTNHQVEFTEDNGQTNETRQSTSTTRELTNGSNNIESDQGNELQNSPTDVTEMISEIGSSGDIFNEHKIIVFSVIAIAVPVILAVMYKFLAPVWRKKMKKIKMKKIINLCDEKKTKEEAANTFIEKNQSE